MPAGVPIGNSSFTIAAWVKTSAVGSRQTIISWGSQATGQYNGFRTGDNQDVNSPGEPQSLVQFDWGGPGYDVARACTIDDGQWHHVAMTYDSAAAVKQLYLDGLALGAPEPANALNVQSQNFMVGATVSYGLYFTGQIDDLRVYNNALSGAEISTLASVPEPSTILLLTTGLIGLLAYAWRKRK